jgi:ribosomal protein S18 acetylase RimI-like enzyme
MNVRTMMLDDVEGATSVHMTAFRDHLNVMFGFRYNYAFLKWFVNHEETISLVGLDNTGLISGYVVGAAPGYQKDLTKALLPYAFIGFLKRPWILFNPRIQKAAWARLQSQLSKTGTESTPPNSSCNSLISLVGICTSQSESSKGLATLLEMEFINQAKARKFSAARLTVYANNLKARRFYEKSGWECADGTGETIAYFKQIK